MALLPVVFVGGPFHGERRVIEAGNAYQIAPDRLLAGHVRKSLDSTEASEAWYVMRPLADAPGAIVYEYEEGQPHAQ